MQLPAWFVHESHVMDHQPANSTFASTGKLTAADLAHLACYTAGPSTEPI